MGDEGCGEFGVSSIQAELLFLVAGGSFLMGGWGKLEGEAVTVDHGLGE